MGEVGIRALKQNASEVVSRAARGEVVTVTDRKRPVARIVPLVGSRFDELLAAGELRPPLRDFASVPAPSHTGSLSADVSEARDRERY